MTARQRDLIDFVERFIGDNGFSPSFTEIQIHLGLKSISTVHKAVHHMKALGLLTVGCHLEKRSITVPGANKQRLGNCLHCEGLRAELDSAVKTIKHLERKLMARG